MESDLWICEREKSIAFYHMKFCIETWTEIILVDDNFITYFEQYISLLLAIYSLSFIYVLTVPSHLCSNLK
jgi:hypothetical protein